VSFLACFLLLSVGPLLALISVLLIHSRLGNHLGVVIFYLLVELLCYVQVWLYHISHMCKVSSYVTTESSQSSNSLEMKEFQNFIISNEKQHFLQECLNYYICRFTPSPGSLQYVSLFASTATCPCTIHRR
jgi:hypothetical protein